MTTIFTTVRLEASMYHRFVRKQLLHTFERLNARDYDAVMAVFDPAHVEHSFPGQHALGGTRRTMEACRRWYARLARVLPVLRFDVRQVTVAGWPWDTRAAVEWSDEGRTADGEPFRNQGVHLVRIRWGRVTSLTVFCDTATLA